MILDDGSDFGERGMREVSGASGSDREPSTAPDDLLAELDGIEGITFEGEFPSPPEVMHGPPLPKEWIGDVSAYVELVDSQTGVVPGMSFEVPELDI